MTKEELEKLNLCCLATGKSRSEIIRAGIDLIYDSLDELKKNDRDGASLHKNARPSPANNCPKAMPRKYYTMRRVSFQALLAMR